MPDKFIGQPCDEDGDPLDPFSPPILENRDPTDWTPFRNRIEFETAEFLYKRCQMSGANIDILMELWAAYSAVRDPEDISETSSNLSPFSDHRDLYRTIDAIPIGGVPWQSITLSYDGPIPNVEIPPSWITLDTPSGLEIRFYSSKRCWITLTSKISSIMPHTGNMNVTNVVTKTLCLVTGHGNRL